MKFKKGDKVECTTDNYKKSIRGKCCPIKGHTYTVSGYKYNEYPTLIELEAQPQNFWDDCNFELVKSANQEEYASSLCWLGRRPYDEHGPLLPAVDWSSLCVDPLAPVTLQNLIDAYNVGQNAIQEAFKNFPGKFQISNALGGWQAPSLLWHSEARLTPKELRWENYKVEFKGPQVTIGCQTFLTPHLHACLNDILDFGSNRATINGCNAYTTYKGVSFMGSTYSYDSIIQLRKLIIKENS